MGLQGFNIFDNQFLIEIKYLPSFKFPIKEDNKFK